MEKIALILGQNIAKMRKERIGSQEKLAELCGYDIKSINRWENGKTWPELEAVRKIADQLQVELESLFIDPASISRPGPKEVVKLVADAFGVEVDSEAIDKAKVRFTSLKFKGPLLELVTVLDKISRADEEELRPFLKQAHVASERIFSRGGKALVTAALSKKSNKA